MKKTVSAVLVAVIIALSVFSVNCFAATPKTDVLLSQIRNANEMSVTFTAGNTLLGTSTDTVYVKGNSVAYDYKTGFLSARVILKDGQAFAYLPLLPFFYVKLDNTGLKNVDVHQLIDSVFGITMGVLNYVKSYDEAYDGKTYYVEEYNDRAQVTSKFYYDGDTLKMLIVNDARTGSHQVTLFENYSFTVSDSVFAAPAGLDLSVVLKWLFNLIIAA